MIQSLQRAGAILDALAVCGDASLADISRAVGLNKTTTFYLVKTLVSLGFVAWDESNRTYSLGLKHLVFGRSVQRRLNIVTVSRPSLLRLCLETKETVNLAIPSIYDALIVESLEGAHGVRATSYAGTRAPYHSTACGKAILAFQDEAVCQFVCESRPLTQVTPMTLTDGAALRRQLAEIRVPGYSLDLEENELIANCVAAPIFDGFGEVAGAISISGPTSRMLPALLVAHAKLIVDETLLIAKALGTPDRA
ncbi:MAG: IclR family transcriptional regulator [Methylobacteriaceae bacterium]|nr:IclR family transcriptional regulator [Methylobacteriaceae bacterium]